MKEINIKDIKFESWKNIIDYKGCNQMTKFWGKTYFYYNKDDQKFYYENLTIFGRIFHRLFGYKKELSRENLWNYLKDKIPGIFQEAGIQSTGVPEQKKFRETTAKILHLLSKNLGELNNIYKDQGLIEKNQQSKFANMYTEGKIPKDWTTGIGMTPLHVACTNGMTDLAKKMIDDQFVPINATIFDTYGTPLHFAIQEGHLETVQMLVSKGAKLDIVGGSQHPFCPLTEAVECKQCEIVRYLLDNGGNVNETTQEQTLLHIAVLKNHKEMVQLLLAKNADRTLTDTTGNTPLKIAEKSENQEIIQLFKNK